MEEWKEYKLHEIGRIVGGATPPTKDSANYDGEISWITPKDLSNFTGRYIQKGERTITQKGFESSSCQILPKGSILFSSRAPIGYIAIAANELCTNQGFKSIIPDNNLVNNLFLYYLLKYNKEEIEGLGSGTTFKEVSAKVMQNFDIKIPCIQTQKKIADILSSLDNKIELNKRINDNLEQQAQALFKSWFVDFEPFKKGKFIDSELGMIPEGWQVEELGNITNSITEKVGKRTDIKVLSPVNTGDLLLSEEYFTKQVYSKNLAKYIMVAPNDFAYNPARINIGSIGMNTFDFSGCVSPVYVVFRCEKEYHHFFNIFKATKNFKEEVNTRAIGGVRQTLSYKDFSLIKIVYPPKEVVEQFNKIYSHIMTLIKKNVLENKRLHQTRDTLLPKLMSGELKINDINN